MTVSTSTDESNALIRATEREENVNLKYELRRPGLPEITCARALVQAMETRVEVVELGADLLGSNVTLGINDLTTYSGVGRCRRIIMIGKHGYVETSHIEKLRSWASNRHWRGSQRTLYRNRYNTICLIIGRNQEEVSSEEIMNSEEWRYGTNYRDF